MKNRLANRENNTLKVGSYDYQGLAHWYFYNNGMKQTADYRMSCEYNKVFSYQTCIGKLHEDKSGGVLFLTVSKKHSLTTSGHIATLLNASPHHHLVVDNVSPHSRQQHIDNLQIIYDEMLVSHVKASRARSQHMITSHLTDASNRMNTINTYCEFFKLKNTSIYTTVNSQQFDASELNRVAQEHNAKQKEKFIKQNTNLCNRIYKAWINHKPFKNENNDLVMVNSSHLASHNKVNNYNLIRVRSNNRVETSLGSQVPLKHAKKWLTQWENNELVVGQKIGGFEIKTVSKEYIKIGCTRLSLKQVQEILK